MNNIVYHNITEEDELVFKIFKNFDSEFKKYLRNKNGCISDYLKQNNIKRMFYLILEEKNDSLVEKKGEKEFRKIIIKHSKNQYYLGNYKNNKKTDLVIQCIIKI